MAENIITSCFICITYQKVYYVPVFVCNLNSFVRRCTRTQYIDTFI